MPLRSLTLSAAVAVLAAGTLAAPALAAKPATKAQKAAITRAIHRSPVAGIKQVPQSKYRVTRVKISTRSSSWAVAWQVATKAARGTFQDAYVVLVRLGGTNTWVVVDAGTALVGCSIAPDSVVRDLTGFRCPPGEGVG